MSKPDRPSADGMPTGSIVAITGRVWLKTATGVWESTGSLNITRDGWIEGLFSDGYATVLRLGTGAESSPPPVAREPVPSSPPRGPTSDRAQANVEGTRKIVVVPPHGS